MSGKAAKIMCTEQQQSILQQISRSTTTPQRLVQRVGTHRSKISTIAP
jgi:hypothetical protein